MLIIPTSFLDPYLPCLYNCLPARLFYPPRLLYHWIYLCSLMMGSSVSIASDIPQYLPFHAIGSRSHCMASGSVSTGLSGILASVSVPSGLPTSPICLAYP